MRVLWEGADLESYEMIQKNDSVTVTELPFDGATKKMKCSKLAKSFLLVGHILAKE